MEKKCNCNEILCNICTIAYCSIIIVFIVIIIVACSCILKLFYPQLELGSYAEIFTAIIALFASIVTYNEYMSTKDIRQAQVLSEYNKRYSEDPNIVKVVKYLNYIDTDGTKNNPPQKKPSNYEVEMFMRFFEELELQIQCGRLNEKDVIDLFIYYAKKIDKNKDLREFLGITDYNENWKRYINLMNKK